MRCLDPTIVELRFVERLTLALFAILNQELKCQVSMALLPHRDRCHVASP